MVEILNAPPTDIRGAFRATLNKLGSYPVKGVASVSIDGQFFSRAGAAGRGGSRLRGVRRK